jgi:hypothetical protein
LSQHPNNRSKIINSGGISILEHARDTTISPTKAHAEDILKILNKESRAKKTLNYVAKRLNIKK